MTTRHPVSDWNVLVTCQEPLSQTIEIWNFDIVCNLNIVIWNFSAVSEKANCFYLNQLEFTLTIPWFIPVQPWILFLQPELCPTPRWLLLWYRFLKIAVHGPRLNWLDLSQAFIGLMAVGPQDIADNISDLCKLFNVFSSFHPSTQTRRNQVKKFITKAR